MHPVDKINIDMTAGHILCGIAERLFSSECVRCLVVRTNIRLGFYNFTGDFGVAILSHHEVPQQNSGYLKRGTIKESFLKPTKLHVNLQALYENIHHITPLFQHASE